MGILPQYYQDYVRGKMSYAQASGQQPSTPTPAPTTTAPASSSSSKPSWMGSMYSQVPGTNWYSTNPSNPNASKYYADGTPVASVGYSNQQTGTHFDGYANPQQFQQLMTNAQSGNLAGNNSLYEDWIKNGQLTSNSSIYGNNPTYPTSSVTVGSKPPSTTPNMSAAYAPAASGQSATLTPSTSGTPTNVYDPSFLNQSSDSRLAAFKSNPQLAQQEIARDKAMYDQYIKAEQTDKAQAAHLWADQVRQAAGISNDDPTYGNALNSAYLVNTPPAGAQDNSSSSSTSTSTTPTATNPAMDNNTLLNNNVQSMVQNALNPQSAYWSGLQAQAANSASQIVQQKQQQLDTARQSLDDQYFQKYLQARDQMAGRGLSNSGLATDADTRLSLAKQQDLGNVFAQLGTFNPAQIQSDEFQKLYADASKNMLQGAGTLADLYKANLPYTAPTQDAVLSSQTAMRGQDMQKIMSDDNLAEKYYNDNLTNDFHNAQLSQQGKIEMAKIDIQLKQYNLDVAKVMGVDSNGNPTLDMRNLMATVENNRAKLAEQTRHDLVSESTAAFNAATSRMNAGTSAYNAQVNASLRAQEIANTAKANTDRMNMQLAQLQNNQLKEQGGALLDNAKLAQSKLDALVSQANSYRSANTAVPQDLQDSIDKAAKQVDDNGLAMEMLYKVDSASRPVSAPPTGGMGYDPTE